MQKHIDAESLMSCARDSWLDLELVVRSSHTAETSAATLLNEHSNEKAANLVRQITQKRIEDVVNL